jgi:PTH1 family peptidyl-tRNA hydrolase
MIIVVGLGNPGRKYEKTRHNIGARVVEALAKRKQSNVVFAKTKTFMNSSGQAVKELLRFYKTKPQNLYVIHDDIDLPLGKIKIARNRGAAGHKGVESIVKELKTKDFNRIRIGICPKTGKPKTLEKFVLKNFTKEEEKIIKKITKETLQAIQEVIYVNK